MNPVEQNTPSADPFLIEVRLEDGDPRVCDYCNVLLVNEDGITEEDCFSTDYGLMCSRCLGGIPPLSTHQKGDFVKSEAWYKGFPSEEGR